MLVSAIDRSVRALVNPGGGASSADLRRAVGGRTVLVTGASHGIGRATATRLAGAGAHVLLVARSGELLEEVAAELGTATPYRCDLTDTDAVADLAAEIVRDHGAPDVLVNNAGKSIRRSVAATYDRFHDITRTTAVNYLGPVRLLLGMLPTMRERGSGHIVNVSTIGVLVPPAPRWSAYQASKAAYDVWLRSVAAETAADGVTASSVYMALVHTRMSAPTSDFKRVPGLTAEQAAGVVCGAIVRRPSAVAPWWATAASVASSVARGPSEAVARAYGRSLPEQTTPRAEVPA